MPNYNSQLQSNNIDLQEVLQTLQTKAAGTKLPELANEGTASDLLSGKELIDGDGNIIAGTMPDNGDIILKMDGIDKKSVSIPLGYTSGGLVSLDSTIDDEVDTQADLISQIASVLEGKAVSGGGANGSLDDLVNGTITSYSNSAITAIRDYAFYNCASLTAADLPAVTTIGSNAFNGCVSMTAFNAPQATKIGNNAFASCKGLAAADFQYLSSIGGYTFYNCFALSNVNMPQLKSMGGFAFGYCKSLQTVNFGQTMTIVQNAFTNCFKLSNLTLTASSLCALGNSNAFTSTPYTGYSNSFSGTPYIYVPAALVDTYKSATNWAYFSSYLSAIENDPPEWEIPEGPE